MYSIEEFDKAKTKVLTYIMYKKRTENEVRKKFEKDIDEELLDDIIEYLKQANYIDDSDFIKKQVNNFKILKNLSVAELKYKLMAKGLDKNLVEDYIYLNQEELIEYEIKSACNIINKKRNTMEEEKIINYLLRKGYKQDNVKEALNREEEVE